MASLNRSALNSLPLTPKNTKLCAWLKSMLNVSVSDNPAIWVNPSLAASVLNGLITVRTPVTAALKAAGLNVF